MSLASSYSSIVTILLMLSSLMSLWTKSWLLIWLLMEINLMMFIYIMMSEKKKEKMILFFMFQSMASMALLLYLTWTKSTKMESNHSSISLIILCAMMMKIGIYPFFLWVVELSKSLKWESNLILMTWQKIIPFMVMMKMSIKMVMNLILLLSMTLITMMAYKLSNLKMMMMSSSLIHSSWAIMALKMMTMMFIMYLTVYLLILNFNIKLFKKTNSKTIPMPNVLKSKKLESMVNMMNLSGLPPFTGFVLKMMVIYFIIKMIFNINMTMMMVMVSALTFYLYMQIIFKNMLLTQKNFMHTISMMKNMNMNYMSSNITIPLMIILY